MPNRSQHQPSVVYVLAEQLRAEGVDLDAVPGPWRPVRRWVDGEEWKGADLVPVVTNDRTEITVDTMDHAADVAGLLNWCGVDDLNPVPELAPPAAEALASPLHRSPPAGSSGARRS